MIDAICDELILRKVEAQYWSVEHIYFGGGTPSLCTSEEITKILETIYQHYEVVSDPEITLEANPDDLTFKKIKALVKTNVNRLSIGVQSFFEEDLQLMNRAHNSKEALQSIQQALNYFSNISVDLIYGIPGMSLENWDKNIQQILNLAIPHISCYALTVEENTALKKMIANKKIAPINEDLAAKHYQHLVERLRKSGYINYEFSNFGKPGFFSGNNTAYWQGKPYIGIGPSAHSFDGTSRSWNVANNAKYIKALEAQQLPSEKEILSTTDRYNEYIMTGLRTQWGVSKKKVEEIFGSIYINYLEQEIIPFVEKGQLREKDGNIYLTQESKFIGDGISSDLFFVD